ncbi:MAG: hypothetical protein F2840_10540 [Actinobacteria bacterium]|nr:hypothetical protein [Actinomycetota bacterium]
MCDANLQYACGDIGESGVGTVFYASSTAFACGANMASTCNYLEAAPNMWNPNSSITCKQATTGTSCGGSLQTTSDFSSTGQGFFWCLPGQSASGSGTEQGIGSGFANTTAMMAGCNSGNAANVARSYTGGGLTDWSLGSQSELLALCAYPNRAAIGGFTSGQYWSSSIDWKTFSWFQNFFSTCTYDWADNSNAYGVRPVRAF